MDVMEDEKIVQLFWSRSEQAIEQTARKYGAMLLHIARNILRSREDSEECVNDTYLAAWDSMPPRQPQRLSPFLGRITRNFALDRYDYLHAQKRNTNFSCLLGELQECIPGTLLEAEVESRAIGKAVDAFLDTLPTTNRGVFLRRYWYGQSIAYIAKAMQMSESKVKSMLYRSRNRLRVYLEQEGIEL